MTGTFLFSLKQKNHLYYVFLQKDGFAKWSYCFLIGVHTAYKLSAGFDTLTSMILNPFSPFL